MDISCASFAAVYITLSLLKEDNCCNNPYAEGTVIKGKIVFVALISLNSVYSRLRVDILVLTK